MTVDHDYDHDDDDGMMIMMMMVMMMIMKMMMMMMMMMMVVVVVVMMMLLIMIITKTMMMDEAKYGRLFIIDIHCNIHGAWYSFPNNTHIMFPFESKTVTLFTRDLSDRALWATSLFCVLFGFYG